MSKPIYRMICDNITDDILAPDFSLNTPSNPAVFPWAPGAWDGVLAYHTADSPMDAAATRAMVHALKAAGRRDVQSADELFAALCTDHKAVRIVDILQNYIIQHTRQLAPDNIYQTALQLILTSENIESVKIGLEMLELFGNPDEDIKEIVRRLLKGETHFRGNEDAVYH